MSLFMGHYRWLWHQTVQSACTTAQHGAARQAEDGAGRHTRLGRLDLQSTRSKPQQLAALTGEDQVTAGIVRGGGEAAFAVVAKQLPVPSGGGADKCGTAHTEP